MIKYELSIANAHRHFLQLQCLIPVFSDEIIVQLPIWRPGRYERGDFAKNVRRWQVYSAEGAPLKSEKISSHTWKIQCGQTAEIRIEYDYYASILNAGSTWVDETQLYVNPVNCFLYLPSNQETAYEVKLNIPDHWQIATGLKQTEHRTLVAKNVQEIMDSPFIGAPKLEHLQYTCQDIPFHIWINGDLPVERTKLIADFEAFTNAQLQAFGSFPVEEYHFLFQFTPYKSYHGVEHENSTVIALGPSSEIVPGKLYEELLGVSCHELYHTWNIKNIRPAEMMPYDFSRENYTRLGYVAEGVTTYFGDQFLHRCGVYSDEQYFKELTTLIDKHLENPGRFNLSLADSSFDTWLDGYVPGIPWRKVSIYNEGALCAFLTDVAILSNSENSLDDVMLDLYKEFGNNKTGYTESDYRQLCENKGQIKLHEIFDALIYGCDDYMPPLQKAFSLLGFELTLNPSELPWEAQFGFRIDESLTILSLLPDSAADRVGIWVGDRIISWNGVSVNSLADLKSQDFNSTETEIIYRTISGSKTAKISQLTEFGYKKGALRLVAETELYQRWKNR